MTKLVRLGKWGGGERPTLLCPLPLWERAATSVNANTFGVRGLYPRMTLVIIEQFCPRRQTPHPALRATFAHKGRGKRGQFRNSRNMPLFCLTGQVWGASQHSNRLHVGKRRTATGSDFIARQAAA